MEGKGAWTGACTGKGAGVCMRARVHWQGNVSLVRLNLRLNRVGEKGACYLFEGLKTNAALLSLNISANGIGDGSGQVLSPPASRLCHRLPSVSGPVSNSLVSLLSALPSREGRLSSEAGLVALQ